MRTPCFLLSILLAFILTACGGGGDNGPDQDLSAILNDLEADNQRLQNQLAQAEQERQRREAEANQPQPEPETDVDTEADEVWNPQGIVDEPWVWHDGRFIPLSQVPVEEAQPEAAGWDVYLPWGYHERPSIETFGPWDDTTTVRGDLSHATFGVTLRDGAYVPWMQGKLSEHNLYANDHVQRTYDEYGYFTFEWSDFRWRGFLIGFTPEGQPVTGNATLSDFFFFYDGTNYDGDSRPRGGWKPGTGYLAFTELAYEDGSMWGDGDLEYEVALGLTLAHSNTPLEQSFSHPYRRFNCSRHPSGCSNDSIIKAAGVRPEGYATTDAGEVRGLLFGPAHEAMAGTLQRDDLTAAFGGER